MNKWEGNEWAGTPIKKVLVLRLCTWILIAVLLYWFQTFVQESFKSQLFQNLLTTSPFLNWCRWGSACCLIFIDFYNEDEDVNFQYIIWLTKKKTDKETESLIPCGKSGINIYLSHPSRASPLILIPNTWKQCIVTQVEEKPLHQLLYSLQRYHFSHQFESLPLYLGQSSDFVFCTSPHYVLNENKKVLELN